jgi:protein-disulfide isomerase
MNAELRHSAENLRFRNGRVNADSVLFAKEICQNVVQNSIGFSPSMVTPSKTLNLFVIIATVKLKKNVASFSSSHRFDKEGIQPPMSKLSARVTAQDHSQGKTNAPWTLVEYADYQCPSCGDAFTIIKQLQKHFGDDLRFVFRNFPLEMHPYAEHAAETAEFASAHGKFWEMHDALFEHQRDLRDAVLLKSAVTLRLSSDHLKSALTEGTYAPRVKTDLDSGIASDVQGTPTFYINGQRHDGSYDFDSMVEAIQSHTKLKTAL